MRNELAPRTERTFRVVAVDSNTMGCMRDGLKIRVSKDRVVKASFMDAGNWTSLKSEKSMSDRHNLRIYSTSLQEVNSVGEVAPMLVDDLNLEGD